MLVIGQQICNYRFSFTND